jgi:hypothetical protein
MGTGYEDWLVLADAVLSSVVFVLAFEGGRMGVRSLASGRGSLVLALWLVAAGAQWGVLALWGMGAAQGAPAAVAKPASEVASMQEAEAIFVKTGVLAKLVGAGGEPLVYCPTKEAAAKRNDEVKAGWFDREASGGAAKKSQEGSRLFRMLCACALAWVFGSALAEAEKHGGLRGWLRRLRGK